MRDVIRTALGVFLGILAIVVVLNLPAIIDWTSGVITGWDSTAKANHEKQLELNRKYVDRLP